MPKQPDLTVIVTAHSEGLLAHKTLRSVERACLKARQDGFITEIIVSSDRPDATTRDYLDRSPVSFKLTEPDVGDLALSRNTALKQARGQFISFIDADDLMSENWLSGSLLYLSKLRDPSSAVAHSEHTLVFEGELALVKKHPSQTIAEDSLLSVFANRWTSVIIAHRSLFDRFPYQANRNGYGYEDWLLNCLALSAGMHHELIPETVIFVRRKHVGSLLQGQAQSKAMLRANPLLAFGHIRQLALPRHWQTIDDTSSQRDHIRDSVARASRLLNKSPKAKLIARRAYHATRRLRASMRRQPVPAPNTPAVAQNLPDWLIKEWRAMQSIDKELFPNQPSLARLGFYDSMSPSHIRVGSAYKRLVDACIHDKYDYVLFVPWLVRGGGDLVAIRYANTIRSLQPTWNVLVIGTVDNSSPCASKLKQVEFLNFGSIAKNLEPHEQERLMEQFIENSGCKRLHVINSLFGYQWCMDHKKYLQANNYRVTVTSFSQSRDPDGYVYGYSHLFAPQLYDICSLYTTDNTIVKSMWVEEYGFDPAKIEVHVQPVDLPKSAWHGNKDRTAYKILWASRLSPEKQPGLVAEIGRLIHDLPVMIEMYGEGDIGFDHTSFVASLPSNVTYVRRFQGFNDLPYQDYDAFLYTSLFDGMPNIVLEAAASGLPIVTSAVGGVPSLIKDEDNGILVHRLNSAEEYARAIRRLLGDNQARLHLGISARQTVSQKHSWSQYEHSVKQMLKRLA